MAEYPDSIDDENIAEIPEVAVSRELSHANEELVLRYEKVKKDFEKEHPGKKLFVSCSYRSPEEQKRIYAFGRFGNPGPILTYKDGKNKKSRHNVFPSTALDVFVNIGGKAVWAEEHYWSLLPLCKKHNLESGGAWSSFSDWCHIQLPSKDT